MKHSRPDGIDPSARSRARRRALQAVYAWQMSGSSMTKVLEQFRDEQDMDIADLQYFEELLRGLDANLAEVDEALTPFLDRPMDLVDPIERGVLRLAVFELLHRLDVPYRVVINEAIEIAKRFGSEHGHTYINGVLDRGCQTWRADEARGGRRG
ncbi:MAG: transcription antitermination factor NusB [Aquimonas sp.]|nr:transcription antitermination factor NusB [Aquimonas sp.]